MEPNQRKVGPPQDEKKGGGVHWVVKQYCSDLRRAQGATSKQRDRWKKFQRAYSSTPFDESVVSSLSASDRILANFNLCLSTINALIGQQQADRKEATFVGLDKGTADAFCGELLTDLVRHLFLRAKGHRHLSRAQFDQLICGYGWMEVFMDSTVFPFKLSTRHVDIFRMFWDPDYQEDNVLDARFVIQKSRWYIDDAVARWPKHGPELHRLLAIGASSGETGAPKVTTGDWMGYSKGPSDTNYRGRDERSLLDISDYQFRWREPWVTFEDPETGEERQVTRDEYDKLIKAFQQIPGEPDPATGQPTSLADQIKGVAWVKDAVYRCWIAGTDDDTALVLEEPKKVEEDSFTYLCATGYPARDDETALMYHFGMMSLLFEPQMWVTKSFSSAIDFIARQMKGGGIYKPSSVMGGIQTMEAKAAQPGAWIAANPEADLKGDFLPNGSIQFPPAYERILDFAITIQPKIANVTDADKGTLTGERSNVLISNLQQHSQTVLNPLFDPLAQLQLDLSRLFARFAQKYLPPKIIDRILGERKCEGITFNKVVEQPPVDPATGQPAGLPVAREVPVLVDPFTRQPIQEGAVDPQTGQPVQGVPIAPSDILRRVDILDYDVEVDLGAASTTSKQAFISAMMQTAFGKTLAEYGVLDRFLPHIALNWPGLPANDAKKLAADLEADSAARRAMQNSQAIMQAIMALPPDQQVGLAHQIISAYQQPPPAAQGGGQAPAAQA